MRCFVFLLSLIFLISCSENSSFGDLTIHLEELSPRSTGIDFNNRVHDTPELNVFKWNFLYQGAGVAIADFDNDGLMDIYFCGNLENDRIYRNLGEFRFEDKSSAAGIQDGHWSTGVATVDINYDGLMDIYLCKNSHSADPEKRKNKLFINKGNFQFEESASNYGIADEGFSVHASFFDVENDGDLDLYLVNQPVDQFASLLMPPELIPRLPISDKLFINQNGRFQDLTSFMQMDNARFGLNSIAGDLNSDGWTDLFVSNDYFHLDQMYINQTRKKFADEIKDRLDHSSFYSMGADVADINNDGHLDLMVLDMSYDDHVKAKTNMGSMQPEFFQRMIDQGHYYQYAFNTLQINNGEGEFSDIAHLAGVASSDWSWAPLLADIDNDGFKDLLVTNGLVKDLRNNDFTDYIKSNHSASVDERNYEEIMDRLPSTPVKNKFYHNINGIQFEEIGEEAGFDFEGFSTGMAYGDLDNDGDLDVVINNTNEKARVYENKNGQNKAYLKVTLEGPPKNPFGIGARVFVYAGGKSFRLDHQLQRGYMSSVSPGLIFGLGEMTTIDSVIVYWDHQWRTVSGSSDSNIHRTISYNNKESYNSAKTKKLFAKRENILEYTSRDVPYNDFADEVLLPHKFTQEGPGIAVGDVNNDQLDDLFICGSKGYSSSIFLQTKSGDFVKSINPEFKKTQHFEDVKAELRDLDSDGDLDLMVSSAMNEKVGDRNCTRIYTNDSNGLFTQVSSPCLSIKHIKAFDLTGVDSTKSSLRLAIGERIVPGKYPKPGSLEILELNENLEVANRISVDEAGMINDLKFMDIDKDGAEEIIAVGEWMPISIFHLDKGEIEREDMQLNGQNSRSWWWSLESADFDNDGDEDLLAGNLGLNNKFHPSSERPLSVHADDFDKDGDNDVILAKQKNGKILPVRGRECSSEEIPFVAEKFSDYQSYALADLGDILSPEQRERAIKYEIYGFESVYLENKGDGKFESKPLDLQCQMGPIKDFLVKDINGDGNLDFIYAGNHYPVEVETVRYDGNKGGVCLGDGRNNFRCLSFEESGIYIDCDAREMSWLTITGREYLIVSCNNDRLQFYQKN